VWLVCIAIYAYASARGVFGPTAPAIFQNSAFNHCRPDAGAKQISQTSEKTKIGNWTRCPDLPPEYSSFSPLAYSLDRILPVVSFGQSNNWGPITPPAPSMNAAPSWIPTYFRSMVNEAVDLFFPQTWNLGLFVRFISWAEMRGPRPGHWRSFSVNRDQFIFLIEAGLRQARGKGLGDDPANGHPGLAFFALLCLHLWRVRCAGFVAAAFLRRHLPFGHQDSRNIGRRLRDSGEPVSRRKT
jgi:hypothetical protein